MVQKTLFHSKPGGIRTAGLWVLKFVLPSVKINACHFRAFTLQYSMKIMA